ncbi:adenylate/guanylate cyclase domain-containing protein [Phormidium sp. CLA17]|uniref:CHASE2 domain-containing protein n=1 Tax=Leptolyngbya sp. Cla-17 TaxID=2803751 RepID=UPI001491C676|nr:adenylate/guanylate cyclase domain-containing protein [Leptolyngbya sp. Cla-17]MBM0742885.1 adenylate/guanylate cyclase domain-containing protein [Leptolyngbya sp. Cla-17]
MLPAFKQNLWRWRAVLIAVPTVAGVIMLLRIAGFLQMLELASLDQLFLLRPQEAIDSRILIVTVDEADIQKFQQYPISDAVLARLLNNLKRHTPTAIGLDIYRNLPQPPGHQELLKIFSTTPNLIGLQKIDLTSDSSPVPPPPALQQRGQTGLNDLPLDADGKVRRGLLYADTEAGDSIFSFGYKLAYQYLERKGVASDLTPDGRIYAGSAIFQPFEENDGGYVRAGAGGYQVLINYRGGIDRFQRVGVMDVLENRVAPELVRDRIVLIGNIAESHKDLFYTPFSGRLGTPERTPGVAIHANLISHILDAALDQRRPIQTLPDWAEYSWIVVWTAIGGVLCWQQRLNSGSTQLLFFKRFRLVIAGGVLLLSVYGAFLLGWWIPLVPALMGLVGSAVSVTGYLAHSAGEMRKTFGRYLTDEVVSNLLETPSGLQLGGERRKVTVLMSDLRGFSAVSEWLPPEKVVMLLNLYFGAMAEVVDKYKGTINEFIGDGIFVMFGAPVSRADDAQRAIACAVAMQCAMATVNEQNQQVGLPAIEMGIGIHTGEVVVGNVGSQKRAKYTVIGNHVNLAARIESYTVGGQILISEDTLKDANCEVRIDGQLQVEPKGIRVPITLYEVGGIGVPYELELPQATDVLLSLKQAISLDYTVLEGKHAVGNLFQGSLIRLSDSSAELQTEHPLDLLSNLKLHIHTGRDRAPVPGDLYAKVLKKVADQEDHFLIRFTSIPPEIAAVLASLRQPA